MTAAPPPRTLPLWVVNLFFVVGLVSALAFRLLIVVNHLAPALFRPIWYLGLVGYVAFFAFRYRISQRRRQAIDHFALLDRVQAGAPLSDAERQALLYVLGSVKKSRENWNYLVIFILSILAAAVDLMLAVR
ncbi:MAG: hypothetical protein AB1634_07670 [Thermodesulfobacteriota bacterium]